MPRDPEKKARTTKLKSLLQEARRPIRNTVEEAIKRDIFTDELFERWRWAGAEAEVRRVANLIDRDTNLPTALVVKDDETGDGITAPIQLALFEDAEWVIEKRKKQLDDDYDILVRLHDWCLAKFGQAPAIPPDWRVQA
jgi:hypothetical protein